MLIEIRELQNKKNPISFHLSEISRIIKFIESRMVVARGWGEGEMGSCLMHIEFQFCKRKRILRFLAQQCEAT